MMYKTRHLKTSSYKKRQLKYYFLSAMSTTVGSQNSWVDIPPEVVEEVLGHCDELSLLVLGRVNRQLNTLALSRFFAPKIKGGVLRLSMGHPMRNLHIAFWLPKAIQHIQYRARYDVKYHHAFLPLANSRVQYINDLRDLTSFIHRMPKIVSLNTQYPGISEDREKFNAKAHHEAWERLLAVAISKGCEAFSASEDNLRFTDSPSPRSSWCSDVLVLRSKFWFSHRLGQASGRERRFAQSKSTLWWVQLHGSSFNGSSSVLHTILTQHAITITRLSLIDMDILNSGKAKDTTFKYIHLPALQIFNFTVNNDFGQVEVSPILLLKFLNRHPQLVGITLYANFHKGQVQQLKRRPLTHTPPNFPSLRSLRVSPEAVEWLVPDFRIQCSEIGSIALRGNLFRKPSQDAIRSILNNLHASASMTSPLDVDIWLPLHDAGWASRLHSPAKGGASSCWSRVRNLTLWETGIVKIPFDSIPSVLIDWISSFPSIERLELYPITRQLREELGKSLAVRCPRLRL